MSTPTIILLSLSERSFFSDVSGGFLTKLKSRAEVREVTDPNSVNQVLEQQPQPSTILITDEALTAKKNARTWDLVLSYVQRGGTAVLMGQFSALVRPNNMKPFFSKAGLPWEAGSYHRTTLAVNPEAVNTEISESLLPKYSQKAVFIQNVASTDAWYITNAASLTESHVFAPSSSHNPGQTAVAMAKIGEGRLGYIGDVNGEDGTELVLLAMCGLYKK